MKITLHETLKAHFLRYPKMTPQDAVKLIFQSEFGGGHLITNEAYAQARLVSELADTPRDEKIPTLEPLGTSAYRINLANLPEGLSVDTLLNVFIASAELFSGTQKAFESKLYEVYELIEEKYAKFSRYDYASYLEKYLSSGGGAVHHSIYYNSAYRPAYRVIHGSFVPLLPLLSELDTRIAHGERPTLVIDGRCGSGKTTLSRTLERIYGCGVVHADDFYPEWGTSDSPLDFDRLNREVGAILRGERTSYGVFDCSEQRITHEKAIKNVPFLCVEGSYSSHPSVDFGDVSVFVTVDSDVQLERIEARCPEKLDDFRTRWIPREEAYFEANATSQSCDFIIDTSIK